MDELKFLAAYHKAKYRFLQHLKDTNQLNTEAIVVPDVLLKDYLQARDKFAAHEGIVWYSQAPGSRYSWRGAPVYAFSEVEVIIVRDMNKTQKANHAAKLTQEERESTSAELNNAEREVHKYLKETKQLYQPHAFVCDKLLSRFRAALHNHNKKFLKGRVTVNGQSESVVYLGTRLYGRNDAKSAILAIETMHDVSKPRSCEPW